MFHYKRVITIHDICGLGHSSTAAALPVLSALGHQAIPLPTSILSTQTDGYEHFSNLDLTDNMRAMIAHWQSLPLKAEALYSGYLASAEQADIVWEVIQTLLADDHLAVVDPVLGDNGALYSTMDTDMVAAMQHLIGGADVITPNVTELLALCGLPLDSAEAYSLRELVRHLSQQGPRFVAVTSVEASHPNTLATLAYDRSIDTFESFSTTLLPVHYPGTGDLFASVLTGSLLQGDNFMTACHRASRFVFLALKRAIALAAPAREGLPFESLLPNLWDRV